MSSSAVFTPPPPPFGRNTGSSSSGAFTNKAVASAASAFQHSNTQNMSSSNYNFAPSGSSQQQQQQQNVPPPPNLHKAKSQQITNTVAPLVPQTRPNLTAPSPSNFSSAAPSVSPQQQQQTNPNLTPSKSAGNYSSSAGATSPKKATTTSGSGNSLSKAATISNFARQPSGSFSGVESRNSSPGNSPRNSSAVGVSMNRSGSPQKAIPTSQHHDPVHQEMMPKMNFPSPMKTSTSGVNTPRNNTGVTATATTSGSSPGRTLPTSAPPSSQSPSGKKTAPPPPITRAVPNTNAATNINTSATPPKAIPNITNQQQQQSTTPPPSSAVVSAAKGPDMTANAVKVYKAPPPVPPPLNTPASSATFHPANTSNTNANIIGGSQQVQQQVQQPALSATTLPGLRPVMSPIAVGGANQQQQQQTTSMMMSGAQSPPLSRTQQQNSSSVNVTGVVPLRGELDNTNVNVAVSPSRKTVIPPPPTTHMVNTPRATNNNLGMSPSSANMMMNRGNRSPSVASVASSTGMMTRDGTYIPPVPTTRPKVGVPIAAIMAANKLRHRAHSHSPNTATSSSRPNTPGGGKKIVPPPPVSPKNKSSPTPSQQLQQQMQSSSRSSATGVSGGVAPSSPPPPPSAVSRMMQQQNYSESAAATITAATRAGRKVQSPLPPPPPPTSTEKATQQIKEQLQSLQQQREEEDRMYKEYEQRKETEHQQAVYHHRQQQALQQHEQVKGEDAIRVAEEATFEVKLLRNKVNTLESEVQLLKKELDIANVAHESSSNLMMFRNKEKSDEPLSYSMREHQGITSPQQQQQQTSGGSGKVGDYVRPVGLSLDRRLAALQDLQYHMSCAKAIADNVSVNATTTTSSSNNVVDTTASSPEQQNTTATTTTNPNNNNLATSMNEMYSNTSARLLPSDQLNFFNRARSPPGPRFGMNDFEYQRQQLRTDPETNQSSSYSPTQQRIVDNAVREAQRALLEPVAPLQQQQQVLAGGPMNQFTSRHYYQQQNFQQQQQQQQNFGGSPWRQVVNMPAPPLATSNYSRWSPTRMR